MADEARNREIVQAGYDNVADRYAELEPPGHEWPRMRWLSKLLAQTKPGGAVLDVVCGNGVPATRAMSERERHASIFERFHRWLRPSGWLLLSIEPEAEPGSVRDWLGRPMFFSQYDAETTLELIRAAGFEVVEQAVEPQLEGERPVFFLWVLARKAREPSASPPFCR